LSRNAARKARLYRNCKWQYGVACRSYTEQYLDSSGIFKDAVVSIMATIGKQENVRRSERITATLSRLKAQGVRLGPSARQGLEGIAHHAVAQGT
jgi:DNA invertase Pin-like site-specific DNA recombinase